MSLVIVAATLLLYPLVGAWGRVPLRRFATGIGPVQVVAASTQSSLATLPAMIECARDLLGIAPRVAGLVLPLAVAVFGRASRRRPAGVPGPPALPSRGPGPPGQRSRAPGPLPPPLAEPGLAARPAAAPGTRARRTPVRPDPGQRPAWSTAARAAPRAIDTRPRPWRRPAGIEDIRTRARRQSLSARSRTSGKLVPYTLSRPAALRLEAPPQHQ